MKKIDGGERLAVLENQVHNIDTKINSIETSMKELHGKFDIITTNYVAKETFEEYKKNKWLERILLILVTAILSGLVAFFLREAKV